MSVPVCIICTEDLIDKSREASALRCGHVFHADCLRPWLARRLYSRTCPICREKVTRSRVISKLYFDTDDSTFQELQRKLEETESKLGNRDREVDELSEKVSESTMTNMRLRLLFFYLTMILCICKVATSCLFNTTAYNFVCFLCVTFFMLHCCH